MTSFEEPIIQIIVDEIMEDQQDPQSQIVSLQNDNQELQSQNQQGTNKQRPIFNGKQQFGDKAICRLCKQTTKMLPLVGCIRCHFKYHTSCLEQQQVEPKVKKNEKWKCLKCLDRIELQKQNNKEKLRKKRKLDEPNINALEQIDEKSKITNFLTMHPYYKNQGQILFPIFDEYLIAYEEIFHNPTQRKPQTKEDSDIPRQSFQDVLTIWDAYNNYDKIVSDFLYIEDNSYDSQSNVVGSFIHFRDNHQLYSQKSRKEIYETLKTEPFQILLFFTFFYLKQLIEDVEFELIQKQQQTPFWYLMGFLWYNNRQQYYEILKESEFRIVLYLQQQGILNSSMLDKNYFQKIDENHYQQLIQILIEGLNELKKTQQLIHFRIDNIISNNKIKEQLAMQVKEFRKVSIEQQQMIDELTKEVQQRKKSVISGQYTKNEVLKLQKEMEYISLEIQKNEKEKCKLTKKLILLQARFTQLQEELNLIQIPGLLTNSSMFLGYDVKSSLYYFFLNERDKIFVNWRISWIENNYKWGYYEFDDLQQLLKSLNVQGVKENQLKQNLEEIIKHKLFVKFEKQENDKLKNEGDSTEKEITQRKQNAKDSSFQQSSQLKQLGKLFLDIETCLTNFLNEKNCRWSNQNIRKAFLQSFEDYSLESLKKAIEFFLDNTQAQERLEKLKEGDQSEDVLYIDFDEDSDYDNFAKKKGDGEKIDGYHFQALEQMDQKKIKIRRLPMRLFGTYFENLRQSLLDQVRDKNCDVLQLKTCLIVLKEVIKMYLQKKISEQEKLAKQEKKKSKNSQIPTQIQTDKDQNNINQKNQPSLSTENEKWEEQCKVCGFGGKVILCDTCPRVFHARCLKLKEIPKGKWSCMICLSYFQRQVKTRQTLKKMQKQ